MVLAKPRGDWAEAGQSLAHGLGILDALEEKNPPSALQKQIRTWLEDLRNLRDFMQTERDRAHNCD